VQRRGVAPSDVDVDLAAAAAEGMGKGTKDPVRRDEAAGCAVVERGERRVAERHEHRVGRQERQLGDEVALARQPQRLVLRDREVARMKRAQRNTLEVD